MKRHILLVAGDPSADRHAAALVRALRARNPEIYVSALGGDHLKGVADAFLYPLVGVGGFGFWEPLLKLPQLYQARQRVSTLLASGPVDLVVPIDYYGFNIHIARMARQARVPVAYYISPQIWASRPARLYALKAAVTEMLVILPFEEALYRRAGVPVQFVGHPLVETLPAPTEPRGRTLGLLPGSRPGVIKRHLPLMVESARLLVNRFPDLKVVLFRPSEIPTDLYAEALADAPFVRLTCDSGYHERRHLRVALSVSGTSALENMLLGIPMVITYRLSPLTYAIAKRLIRIPFVGMPNILAEREIVPELLQATATPVALADAACRYLDDETLRCGTRDALLGLRSSLGEGGSARAAAQILRVLNAEGVAQEVAQ